MSDSLGMSGEQLAVLADNIADMAQDFIITRDVKSLRNMATNLAGMIRRHVPSAPAAHQERTEKEKSE